MPSNAEAVKILSKRFIDVVRFPGVVSVGMGIREKEGRPTGEFCIVVGVEKKKDVPEDQMLPKEIEFGGVILKIDVQQRGKFRALDVYTEFKRPTPGGYSCGNELITAGTLGCWVHTEEDPTGWYVLSNNHVLAASNEASIGSMILQPGKYDGGRFPIARLTKFVEIKFGGGEDDKKKKPSLARLYWGLFKNTANYGARLVDCPYRLSISKVPTVQQTGNLVDAALAKSGDPSTDFVDPEVVKIGKPEGFRGFNLGDKVRKSGRTTGYQEGSVSQIAMTVQVNYGNGQIATFEDQVEIKPGGFSAPGDSGSTVWHMNDKHIGGLLFAGSDESTIVNRIEHVQSLLGVRL